MPKRQEIVDYLKAHPDFFEAHQELLAEMKLDGEKGATPFYERQIQVLKERAHQHRAKLDFIVNSAQANQYLELALHRLARGLIRQNHDTSPSYDSLIAAIKTEFDVDKIVVLRQRDPAAMPTKTDYDSIRQRVAHRGSVCDDRLSSSFINTLFAEDQQKIKSCAFIPLTHSDELRGVMILGSANQNRFQPDFGVMFLDRLGELSSAYLHRYLSD